MDEVFMSIGWVLQYISTPPWSDKVLVNGDPGPQIQPSRGAKTSSFICMYIKGQKESAYAAYI